jgi:septum site-determining protein MinC
MNRPAVQSRQEPPFELKGSTFTLSVMRLIRLSMDAIASELESKVKQAPGFFRSAPVVFDLGSLDEAVTVAQFQDIVRLVRDNGMVPVGVRGGSEANRVAAGEAGLAILPVTAARVAGNTAEAPAGRDPAPRSAVHPPEPVARKETEDKGERPSSDEPDAAARTLIVNQPVRSGQQIYSRHGDLMVLKMVSAGAELVANGNIQVLGPLRGRALAGAHGDVDAHIVCQSLQAELVSIAGRYRVFEELDPALRGRAVHIYLSGDRLIVEPL